MANVEQFQNEAPLVTQKGQVYLQHRLMRWHVSERQ